MIELLMMLPALLLLVLGGLQIAERLRTREAVGAVKLDAAKIAFNACRQKYEPPFQEEMESCIKQKVLLNIANQAALVLSEFKIIYSLYVRRGGALMRIGQISIAKGDLDDLSSRFDDASADERFGETTSLNMFLMVEIYGRREDVFPAMPFHLFGGAEAAYDVGVL